MRRPWLLILGGIAATLLLVYLGPISERLFTFLSAKTGNAIGVVTTASGDATIESSPTYWREASESDSLLAPTTSLRTGPTGAMTFELTSGHSFKMDQNSQISIEKRPGGLLEVALIKGKIHEVNKGDNSHLRIVKNGIVLAPDQLDLPQTSITIRISPEDQISAETEIADIPAENTLQPAILDEKRSQDEIDAVIASQTPNLKRCYATLLKKKSKATGKLGVVFQIQASGEITNLRVEENTLKDDDIAKCIVEVLARVKFRASKGSMVVISYPFTFE